MACASAPALATLDGGLWTVSQINLLLPQVALVRVICHSNGNQTIACCYPEAPSSQFPAAQQSVRSPFSKPRLHHQLLLLLLLWQPFWQNLSVVSNCISLTAKGAKHISICLLIIYTSSLWTVCSFYCLVYWLDCLVLCCIGFCLFFIQPRYYSSIGYKACEDFLQFCNLSHSAVSLAICKLFNFMWSYLSVLVMVFWATGLLFRTSLLIPGSRAVCPMYEERVGLYYLFSVSRRRVFPTPFVEGCHFFVAYSSLSSLLVASVMKH